VIKALLNEDSNVVRGSLNADPDAAKREKGPGDLQPL
jgi:hypothetical protein